MYPPVHPSAEMDMQRLGAMYWVLKKNISLDRVKKSCSEKHLHNMAQAWATWVLSGKWIKSNRSRHSEKHVEGNTNKKPLKEINATNRGEITKASPSATGCLLTLQKLMSHILPSKAGFSSEFKKSQAEGQEIAPQNIIC